MINKFYTKGWNIAFKRSEEEKFTVIKNNFGSWMADPFIFEYNNRVFIFGEMYTYDRYKGSIGYCEIVNGKATSWKKIITENYHLSFPNICIENDNIYIYVESCDNKEFYRYVAVDFPKVWKKDEIYISNIEIVDTVLFDYGNDRYCFTYDITNNKNELLLVPFNNNKFDMSSSIKISDDVSCARPAGKVLIHNQRFIRVAQDCNGEYGKALVFFEFNLDNGYEEKLIKRITVDDIKYDRGKWIGIHTYNESNHYQVVDLKFKKIILSSIIYRLFNKVRRFFK